MIHQASRHGAVLLATAWVVGLLWVGGAEAGVGCDPYKPLNDKAMAALSAKSFGEAKEATDQVLAAAPNDFRANQSQGLLTIYTAGRNHKQYSAGIVKLVTTAALLETIPTDCSKQGDYYRIYNTIGAEYFNDSNYDRAQQYYAEAFLNRDKLSRQSLGWLHANLALLAFHDADYGCALVGFKAAESLGNTSVTVRDGLAKLDTIFKAASAHPPACKRQFI